MSRDSNSPPPGVSRRGLLGMGAGVAGAAVLAACGGGGSSTGTTTGGAASTGGTTPTTGGSTPSPTSTGAALEMPKGNPWPSIKGVVTSSDPSVPPAYKELPFPGPTTVKAAPGSGGKMRAFTITWGAPSLPAGQNKWWQQVNKELGVDLDVTVVNAQDFGDKLVTVIASGDIPDITVNEPSYRGRAARKYLGQGVFYDLREFLGGDQVKQYPNLALVPDYAWENSRINGALYGVPCYRNRTIGGTLSFRQDWVEKGGHPDLPKDADDLVAWLDAMKKGGGKNTWPLATIDQTLGFCGQQVFKVANDWQLNADGTLTKDIELPTYKSALEFAVSLHKKGYCHPDIVTLTPNPAQYTDYFASGRVGVCNGSIDAYFGTTGQFAQLATKSGPSAKGGVLIPPGNDGGKGIIGPDLGFYCMQSIPSSVKDKGRIQEILRVMDYLFAPEGSKEWWLMHYGIEGHNFTYENGTITPTTDKTIQQEAGFNSMLAQGSLGFYFPGAPDDAVTCQKYAQEMVACFSVPGAVDPTSGLDSATAISKGDAMGTVIHDYTQAIVTGRKPLSALDEMIDKWKQAGGDQVRTEYEAAIAKKKKAEGK